MWKNVCIIPNSVLLITHTISFSTFASLHSAGLCHSIPLRCLSYFWACAPLRRFISFFRYLCTATLMCHYLNWLTRHFGLATQRTSDTESREETILHLDASDFLQLLSFLPLCCTLRVLVRWALVNFCFCASGSWCNCLLSFSNILAFLQFPPEKFCSWFPIPYFSS